ncbi:MAG: hypothetical protein KME07_21395 [Pegethrix bostrychoides GSE-TBD4-15B]|jgi:hypothetical protein|uniref:Uncharacterized protein n=1 Tax=Pegethrix bostrychoides GSE-TBD4-15B TaxID=2839662 RepID=A0A951PE99_9CYAN|nr:hypothetical protein [Pegethrix bostrychoides GSE-TBD4-15B]
MDDQPMEQVWQRCAVRELSSLLSELSNDRFTTAEDFCIQMAVAAQLLRALYGQSELERIREWRARLAQYSRELEPPESE